MLVLDDRVDLPGERRVRAALAVVVAGLGEVPEVIDHAGADEGAPFVIQGDAPGIAGPFGEEFELHGCADGCETRRR